MSERRYITGCDAVHPDRRGGQHVAMRCTGVLVIDDEKGIGVMCSSSRSQYRNKETADAILDDLTLEHPALNLSDDQLDIIKQALALWCTRGAGHWEVAERISAKLQQARRP